MSEKVPRRYDLRSWLGIFHPAYRFHLFALLGIGLLGGVLTYLNLELLQALVKTFSAMSNLDNLGCAQAAEIHPLTQLFVCNGVGSGWTVALLVLLVYAGLELLQAALSVVRLYVQGLLEIRSRNDIEREVLVNLLRKDDQFFQRHSATQIANRLSEDTERIFERREDISALWSVSVQALGALAFLWSQNWSYAAAAIVFSLGGVYIIHRMLGRMKFLDGAQLQADDNVKAAFEDYLQAAPEAQMGNLTGRITSKLASIQTERQTAFMGLVNLSSKLTATYALTQLVAFGAIMCAIVYVVTVHGFTLEDGLVAAVVRAVPQLYGNISEVAKLVLKFQLADVSARRLLEYETLSEREEDPAESMPDQEPQPITLDGVRYAFTPGGQSQGGPRGISLAIEPNTLNVIVGPSGSGKSMLSQLIMGRLNPIAGRVLHGENNVGELGHKQRSRLMSYMPQSLAMISGSIAENIRFGRAEPDSDEDEKLDDKSRMWIDKTGVGWFSREKALDLPPADVDVSGFAEDLPSMRKSFRERAVKEAKVELVPFAANLLVPHLSVLENITKSAAHTERMLRLTFTRAGFQAMGRLAGAREAEPVIAFGEHVIGQTAHMLARCPTYDAYSELAPFHLHPPVWDLRSNLSEGGGIDPGNPAIRTELFLAGLTATPREGDGEAASRLASAIDGGLGDIAERLREHFEPALEPLSEDSINPALNWRDNLLFATPGNLNATTSRAIDEVLLKAVAETGLDALLLETGLNYEVGRKGKRLSGGQRQLVSLCRTLVQGCPVLILDEPTAALDPRRRSEMNDLLRATTDGHTVVAITHDAELARLADQVIMVKDGQVCALGTFDALTRDSAEFRDLTISREFAAP